MTDHMLKGLRPWSLKIAVRERVQQEDLVRWARTDIAYPTLPEPKEPRKIEVKKILRALTFALP
jgi:hypothetical protein